MGLTAALTAKLESSDFAAQLVATLTLSAGKLDGVTAPAPSVQLDVVVSGLGDADSQPFLAAFAAIAEQALPIVATLPDAQALLGNLGETIAPLETLTREDVPAQFNTLFERLKEELQVPPEGGRIALLIRLLEVLSGAGEGKAVHDLLALLANRAGVDLPQAGPYLDGLRAIDAVVRLLGGMMCVESVLGEAERLSQAMAAMTDPAVFDAHLAAIDAALGAGGAALADRIAGMPPGDFAGVSAAAEAVAGVVARLDRLEEQFASALGMGEATLVYLDLTRLQAEVDEALGMVRTADLQALSGRLTAAAPVLQPFVDLELSSLPPGNLGALLTRAEAEIAGIAARITALDAATFVTPLRDGIEVVTAPLRDANQVLDGIVVALQGALDEVRAAVAALPFESAAEAVRAFLGPVVQVLDATRALVAQIEDALGTAASTTSGALEDIDKGLRKFQKDVDDRFAEAQAAVAAVDLDEVLGLLAEKIQAFSDVIAQAQLQPYFDTAVGAIETATSVVSAVPFGLLPDSMKSDVDAAVKPIRETSAAAVEREIETLLQLKDGKFGVRGDVEAAIKEIHTKYLALIEVVEKRDPRKILEDVDEQLRAIAITVGQLSPELTLQPVADAIESVKETIAAIDLDEALNPVREAFVEIKAALDRYAPGQLVTPLQERIAEVRAARVEQIRLEEWSPTLDELETRVLSLLDLAAPERIEPLLGNALAELTALLDRVPRADTIRGFGTIVAAILGTTGLRIYPGSFPVVAGWIGGASGSVALAVHTDAIAVALQSTRDAVARMDLRSATAGIAGRLVPLRAAVEELIGTIDAESGAAVRLNALLPRLERAGRIAALSQNRNRYLDALNAATRLTARLRGTGFSAVDEAAANFREALQPLGPAWQQLKNILAALGIDPQQPGISEVVRALLREAPPQRIADMVLPVLEALRGRLQVLLGEIIAPLKAAMGELTTLLDAFDLTPLATAADGAVTELKDQIDQLGPDALLAEPLQAFKELRESLAASDPLAPVAAMLTGLRDLIERVLERLSLETLLARPLAIYDDILTELRKLDPNGLLDPVFAQLDDLARQVDTGLDETLAAFTQLQEALPGPGT